MMPERLIFVDFTPDQKELLRHLVRLATEYAEDAAKGEDKRAINDLAWCWLKGALEGYIDP